MPAAAVLLVALAGTAARAQVDEPAGAPPDQLQRVVDYPAAFFARYQPNTALEMVRQVPGFQLDDGGNERGFGASAGNVLINDRRISAKQDRPSAILERIPASQVERIDLIRGQVRNIDMLGQSVVVNIILRGDVPAAMRWEASVLRNFLDSSAGYHDLGMNVSRSSSWGDVNYNAGVNATRRDTGDDTRVNVSDGVGDSQETRLEKQDELAYSANGNLSLSTTIGRALWQMNNRLAWQDFDTMVVSDRLPASAGVDPSEVTFTRDSESSEIEIGIDAESSLSADLVGKGIVLYFQNDRETQNTQRTVVEGVGQTLFRVADSNVKTTETIARSEFEWAGWSAHQVKLNVEGALNVIDGTLIQTVDTGNGPVLVPVPGANTRVEELRGDILLRDTWSLGEWVLDYGLGAEYSEITQTGDLDREDSFFFVKPQLTAIWSPRRGSQSRLRVAREVSQLNLNDFVTQTQFQDGNFLGGSLELEPQNSWVAELTYERRFGDLGVVSLTGFHHWISDAQDFVPITDHIDVAGNIGDARRWGVALESTLPLDGLGLTAARLDLKARWMDSTVIDQVTGSNRQLTGRSEHQGPPSFSFNVLDNNYDFIYDVAFRQDLQDARFAWGWDIANRDERRWYKVDEVNRYNEDGIEFNVFVETTRWLGGTKFRLEATNIMHFTETRDRTLYTGRRGLSPVLRRESYATREGKRLTLTVSGAF